MESIIMLPLSVVDIKILGLRKRACSLIVTRASVAPQVLGSTLHGSEFQIGVKKIPSSIPHQSTGLRTAPFSQGDGATV